MKTVYDFIDKSISDSISDQNIELVLSRGRSESRRSFVKIKDCVFELNIITTASIYSVTEIVEDSNPEFIVKDFDFLVNIADTDNSGFVSKSYLYFKHCFAYSVEIQLVKINIYQVEIKDIKHFSKNYEKIVEYISCAGSEGRKKSDLTKKMQNLKPEIRANIFQMLENSDNIKIETVGIGKAASEHYIYESDCNE
jgi:hypothetical protein